MPQSKVSTIIVFILLPLVAYPDTFRLLKDEKEALQCRIDLIKQAKSEILLSCFIFEDDLVGKTILGLLVEAATERGVLVRLMVDKKQFKVARKLCTYLQDNGIELRLFYLRKRERVDRYYRGLHEKILLVDEQFLVVGGRNIQEHYFDLDNSFNYLDLDVLVTGAAACQDARGHFYASWNSSLLTFPPKFPAIDERKTDAIFRSLREAIQKIDTQLQPKETAPPDSLLRADDQTASAVHFIHDDFFKKSGRVFMLTDVKDKGSTDALIRLVDSARQTILIENPYFIPTKTWRWALQRAIDRGVQVRVLTNSTETNDLILYQAAYRRMRKKLLHMGIELWEYQGPKKLHSKAMVIDDFIPMVGSYNIHYPSEKLNTEVGVWVADSHHAEMLRLSIATDLENALQVGQDNRLIPQLEKNFKKASFKRRAGVWFFQHTVAIFFGKYL